MPEIRELDPKYRDLEDEIDRQIEIWESAKCKGKLPTNLIFESNIFRTDSSSNGRSGQEQQE